MPVHIQAGLAIKHRCKITQYIIKVIINTFKKWRIKINENNSATTIFTLNPNSCPPVTIFINQQSELTEVKY